MFDTTNTYCTWDLETDSCVYEKVSFSLTVSCAHFPLFVMDFVGFCCVIDSLHIDFLLCVDRAFS